MIKDLVSIVTPCYNSGRFIHRLLDSLLMQDYPSIEVVVVDDGSTDNTAEVVKEYISSFQDRGYTLRYIYKENGGQASAINTGLPLLQGEFIGWPDSDDFYTYSYSISTFVAALRQSSDEVGLCRSIGQFVYFENLSPVEWQDGMKYAPVEDSFNAMMDGGDFLMVPINYLAKSFAIDTAIPSRHIYDGRRPQNIQLFDPLTYKFQVIDTDPKLATVVVRSNSDSHRSRTFIQRLDDFNGFLDIHVHTIDNMNFLSRDEKAHLKQRVARMQLNEKLAICLHYRDLNEAFKVVEEMKKWKVNIDLKKRIKVLVLKYFGKKIFNILQRY